MISRVSSSGINQYLKSTSNVVKITQIGSPVRTVYNTEPSNAIPDNRKSPLSFSNKELVSKLNSYSIVVNSIQKRLAHTDLNIPDYSSYRKNTSDVSNKSLDDNKSFIYFTSLSIGVGGAIFAKTAIRDVVSFLNPSKDVLAVSKAEVDLNDIPVGKNLVIKWREKPLFIKHRSPEEINREKSTDLAILRDPQHDHERTKNPEWLIVLGVCTHLGCIPISGAGDFPGGYFCPCHGSHYDGSGRIRKGPAPSNLEVPNYTIKGNILVVG